MKTLKHHVLIFDQNCPLCRTYTSAFIKTGMLDNNGRLAYEQAGSDIANLFDNNRARNEIALVNTKTGNVLYGIDSLFRIISYSFPVFAPLFRLKIFRWLMKKLYSFISFNRKVIIPSDDTNDTCKPDLHVKFRWAYIVFTWLVTSLILTSYSHLLQGFLPSSRFFREFMICGGQVLFQSCALYFVARNKILSYLGNMMTISFAGGLLLFIFNALGQALHIDNPLIYACFFLCTAGLMFFEHIRRMRLLNIHWSASLSWVIYRVIILSLII